MAVPPKGLSDVDYFTQLAGWGYTLSDVEGIVTGDTENVESQTEQPETE